MTLREMLFFSGGVLGPALIAHALAEMLEELPALIAPRPSPPAAVDPAERLLRDAFPNGLEL